MQLQEEAQMVHQATREELEQQQYEAELDYEEPEPKHLGLENIGDLPDAEQVELEKKLEDRLSKWRGPVDKINRAGRKPGTSVFKNKTARELREQELISLLRKLKPLQSKSINAASKIIDNEKSSDQNKLKASALILSTYRSLLLDLYKQDDETPAEEIQSTPVFSLKMIDDTVQDVQEK